MSGADAWGGIDRGSAVGRRPPRSRAARRAACAALGGLLIALTAAPAAHAEFSGTPGQIAYVDNGTGGDTSLKLWEPSAAAKSPTSTTAGVTTLDGPTFVSPAASMSPSLGSVSPPMWSPDGTKIAYSKSIPDDEPGGGYHTAIFVYDLRTHGSQRVSNPPAFAPDPDPDDDLDQGHTAYDLSPAWSPDGTSIIFVRLVAAGRDDSLRSVAGENLWEVPATSQGSGGDTQITAHTLDSATFSLGAVPVPGTGDMLELLNKSGVSSFALVGGSGGESTILSLPLGTTVNDYDVAPDGDSFVYATTGAGGQMVHVASITGSGPQQTFSDFGVPDVRFSNDGNGPLHPGMVTETTPTGQKLPRGGLLERHLDDPDGDVRADEPDRMALPWLDFGHVAPAGLTRSLYDVQAQQLPVILVPGFLGSQVTCGPNVLWPGVPISDAVSMELDASGTAPGGRGCDVDADKTVVDTVINKHVYHDALAFMGRAFPGTRGAAFAWDWRKATSQSLDKLDDKVDSMLAGDATAKAQGVKRVVLFGHSYGGLLIRDYLAKHPEKVARVLTAGTPYWGAPKSIFPLAFGIETPIGGLGLDDLFINSTLKQLAQNLAGLYALYPSAHYGSWLSIAGKIQDEAGVRSFVSSSALGGNAALLDAAQADHASIFDGFDDDLGTIDVRAVAGTGLPTFGLINLTPQPGGDAAIDIGWVDGDGTVPARSAVQGSIGTTAPLGAPVHVQYLSGVDHVDEPGDPTLLSAYQDFLDHGATPRKLPPPSFFSGGQLVFDPTKLGDGNYVPSSTRSTRAAAPRDATGPLSLRDADDAEDISVARLPSQVIVATNDRTPTVLAVTFTAPNSFTYASIGESGTGTELTYTVPAGIVDIAPASAPGGAPTVIAGGRTITPSSAPVTPPAGGPPGPAVGPGARPAPGSPPAAVSRGPAKLQVLGASIAHHRLSVRARITRLADGDPVRLDVRASGKRRRLRATVKKGAIAVVARLTGAQRHASSAIITYTYAGNVRVRPTSVRLRAAAHKARLKRRALSLKGGRLRVSGTIARGARGVVRFALAYAVTTGGVKTWTGRAKIARGRWRLSAKLPAQAARGGYLTIAYTGYGPRRIRGEQAAKQVSAG